MAVKCRYTFFPPEPPRDLIILTLLLEALQFPHRYISIVHSTNSAIMEACNIQWLKKCPCIFYCHRCKYYQSENLFATIYYNNWFKLVQILRKLLYTYVRVYIGLAFHFLLHCEQYILNVDSTFNEKAWSRKFLRLQNLILRSRVITECVADPIHEGEMFFSQYMVIVPPQPRGI